MHTAFLVEPNKEVVAIRTDKLDAHIIVNPPQNSQDRQIRDFKRIHIDEASGVAFYVYGDIKEADAKALAAKEADKFLNPQKYKDMRTETEKLREENAALRTQLAAKAVS